MVFERYYYKIVTDHHRLPYYEYEAKMIGKNIFAFNLNEDQFNKVIDECFNTLLSHDVLHMYEDRTIKCSSCGKSFISKEHERVCQECYKELENIK